MTIACISIPRFAVEAERHRRQNIGARLILLGNSIVYDCSLGAEVTKVRPGMRMTEAIGLCPNAVVLPSDIPYYEQLFNEILDYLETFSPAVEACSTGTAFLALDGLPSPAHRLAEDIVTGLHKRFGFVAAAGIASSKFVARIAATVSRAGTVNGIGAGEEAGFLAPLPAEHLPTSEAMHWRLTMLGLTTIGDIARLPLGAVQAQFGAEGKRCWELAQGLDAEPFTPRTSEATVVRRMQLPSVSVSLDTILTGVERLVYVAYDSLGGSHWVRKAVIRATPEDGGAFEIPVAFREAQSNPADAWFAIKNAVLRKPPERPIEELEVELIGLGGESGKQQSMFEGKGKLWRQVEEAVKQIDAHDGDDSRAAVSKIIPLEPRSRIPERRAALVDFRDS
jgi:nucleotidyltransferase/DNA polymerase involved in DNA repair